jgi:outer membrane beta-barrel protein
MKRMSLFILLTTLALQAHASNLAQKMDALGANKDLMKKARAIDPENRVRVVQNREVDRTWRLEIGGIMGMSEGGDAYLDTSVLGAAVDLHITPRWSVGGRYYNYKNDLTKEGKRIFDDASVRAPKDPTYVVPGVDPAQDEFLGVLSWYPIYGKLNLFDATVSQFDLYVLGGAGTIRTGSGSSPVYTAGGGAGIWLTQHFSTRLEARWQTYQDKIETSQLSYKRNMNETLLTMTVGFLL